MIFEANFIHRMRALMTTRVQHSLREGNTIADYFTNLDFNFAGTFEFIHFQDISIAGKNIINIDKQMAFLI